MIRRKGWSLSRINGSHHVFVMRGRHERIVIPIHGNQPLKVGLLKSLMKIADLTEAVSDEGVSPIIFAILGLTSLERSALMLELARLESKT